MAAPEGRPRKKTTRKGEITMNARSVFLIPVSYSLGIRGTRDRYLSFDSLRELREEVGNYLSPIQKRAGVLDYLTTFHATEAEVDGLSGWVGKSWQNLSTDCVFDVLDR
jgi:hypothetical protein